MIQINKKVAIIGEGGVGKTTMVNKYINGKFSKITEMTIGADFFTKHFEKNNIMGKMFIWDLGGQDRFRQMMKGYLNGSEGIFLVYDLNRLITLIKLREWILMLKEIKIDISGSVPIILIGCKKDLYEPTEDETLQVKEYIEELYENCKILHHFETSSLTNENINESFESMIDFFTK